MPTRFFSKLLLILSLTSFWGYCCLRIKPVVASETSEKIFGENGANGTNGEKGEKGQDSEGLTYFTDGAQTNAIQLSGKDGQTGGNGSNGGDAICGDPPQNEAFNTQGSQGGDGGDAGDGGDGGQGGSLTIYTTDQEKLRQIEVIAGGGKGGAPGTPGQGGQGCRCPIPSWTIDSCTGNPGNIDYSCTTRQYTCSDGTNGRIGRGGNPGRDGSPGTLTLINSNQPLTNDQPSATISLAQVKDRGYTLSRNRWENRTGAVALFAQGSVIADQYLELVERQENSFVVIWNAPQPFTPFAEKTITINLKDNQEVEAIFPDDIWLESKVLEQNKVTQYFVFNALLASQVTDLKVDNLSGSDSDLLLSVVDNSQKSDLIETKFNLKYRIIVGDTAFNYRTRYEGDIPAELVTYSNNTYTIALGKLPIEPNAIKSGSQVEIILEATRSFAGRSAQQKLIYRNVIKGN